MAERAGRRASAGEVHGLAVVDKPHGWTSHDVVARCRRLLGTRKVGHSGTLDPSATGVLLVGAGHATRLLRFLNDLPKAYVGELVLGTTTTTLDADGDVTATFEMRPDPGEVAEAARSLVGTIHQVPPMVSAVKVGGRRLHELAREGIEVERAARPVTVHSLAATPTDDPLVYRLEVACSSGTYVRVLAADLGAALGGGAHLRNLRRTAIGPHTVDTAVALDDVAPERLMPVASAVAHLPRVEASADLAADARQGKVVPLGRLGVGDQTGSGTSWAVVGPGGDLVAVYEPFRPGLAKPAVVLAPAAGGPGAAPTAQS